MVKIRGSVWLSTDGERHELYFAAYSSAVFVLVGNECCHMKTDGRVQCFSDRVITWQDMQLLDEYVVVPDSTGVVRVKSIVDAAIKRILGCGA